METAKNYSNGEVVEVFESRGNACDAINVHNIWNPNRYKHSNAPDRNSNVKSKRFETTSKKECIDEPIDLTFSQKLSPASSKLSQMSHSDSGIGSEIENAPSCSKQSSDIAIYDEATSNTSIAIAKIMEVDQYICNTNIPKKRGRKRKISNDFNTVGNKVIQVDVNVENARESPETASDYLQNMDQKQAEVLKAAKSLFSKRTRTLYHWMYPNTPKTQLKTAVSMSWENLGMQEKEFYISQVLGRFGFPQNSLMVNPQLDGIRVVPPFLALSMTPPVTERKHDSPNHLLSDNSQPSWTSKSSKLSIPVIRTTKKKGKLGRPPGSRNRQPKSDENVIKQIQCESNGDEFQDDPELSREFEQFKWTLHMNDNKHN